MLYLIGIGLNERGISTQGLDIVRRCKKVYLESYTVELPYLFKQLEEVVKKKIISADREFVESLGIVDEAKRMDVALLVYGSPLTATTHISLVQEARMSGIKCKVIYGASVFDAIGETGLQIYKFGKIASMPKWSKSFEPTSFMEIVKENQSIKAHSLILVDIGLEIRDALEELENSARKESVKLKKIVVCSRLGTKDSRIFYDRIESLKEKKIKAPFCIVILGKLHFVEEEFLKS